MIVINSLCIVFIVLCIFCTGIDLAYMYSHCGVPCHAFVVIMLYIVINK